MVMSCTMLRITITSKWMNSPLKPSTATDAQWPKALLALLLILLLLVLLCSSCLMRTILQLHPVPNINKHRAYIIALTCQRR